MITTHRRPNGTYAIRRGGHSVGEAWRMAAGRGFGVNIKGIYWRQVNGIDTPNTRGGSVATRVKLLRDVPDLVEKALERRVAELEAAK